jgi:hypothetical protein
MFGNAGNLAAAGNAVSCVAFDTLDDYLRHVDASPDLAPLASRS